MGAIWPAYSRGSREAWRWGEVGSRPGSNLCVPVTAVSLSPTGGGWSLGAPGAPRIPRGPWSTGKRLPGWPSAGVWGHVGGGVTGVRGAGPGPPRVSAICPQSLQVLCLTCFSARNPLRFPPRLFPRLSPFLSSHPPSPLLPFFLFLFFYFFLFLFLFLSPPHSLSLSPPPHFSPSCLFLSVSPSSLPLSIASLSPALRAPQASPESPAWTASGVPRAR